MQNGPTELKKSHKIQLPFISWDIANTRFEKIKSDVILSYFLLFIYETAECRFLHILQNLMPSMKSWVNLLQNGQIRLKKSHRVQLSHYREMYNIEETKQCINCITFSKKLALRTMLSAAQLFSRKLAHVLVQNSETEDQAMTSQLIYKCDIKIFTDFYLFVFSKIMSIHF